VKRNFDDNNYCSSKSNVDEQSQITSNINVGGNTLTLTEELQAVESLTLSDIEFDNTINSSLVGNWFICYGKNQRYDLVLNEDGVFVQGKPPIYTGKWKIAGQLLILFFESLHLDRENTCITLKCEINEQMNTFRGTKTHPAYSNGVLKYYGSRK